MGDRHHHPIVDRANTRGPNVVIARVALHLLLVVALWSLAPLALAERTRVVLATTDTELVDAVTATLAPWNVDVVVVSEAPGATMPGAAERGRALADTRGAAVAVWISESESGAALWTYDRERDRVVSRALPLAPPYDEASAASVALSIKTLLRHSDAAPIGERLVVSEPEQAPSIVRLELGLGLRAPALREALEVDPRLALGGAFWLPDLPWLGLGLSARAGLGVPIVTPEISARLVAVDAIASFRLRFVVLRELDLGGSLGVGATFGLLDATVHPSERRLTDVRADAAVDASLEIGWRPSKWLRVALAAGAFAVPQSRSYFVRGQEVAETSTLAGTAELRVEFPLDGRRVDGP